MTELFENHVLIYTILYVGIVVFSVLTNSLFLRFVQTLGIRKMDAETIIRWGPKSKPALGGFNFYIVFLLCIALNSMLFDPNQFFLNKEFVGLLLCITLGFIIGLADDAYDTRPYLKLAGQLVCGVILFLSGNGIKIFNSEWLNFILTILWVVGIMNSINMLDNMDAIAAVVGVCILISCLTVLHQSGHYLGNIYFIVMLGVVGALIAFLYFNWHPSKMYMGDTGSQFLGALLSAVGIIFFWNYRALPDEVMDANLIFRNLTLVLLVFIMPLIDTTVVVVNRIRAGHSPFVGGKDHTTHNLARLGFSDRSVAIVFASMCFVSILLVLFVTKYVEEWQVLYTLLFIGYFVVTLAFFFLLTRLKNVEYKKEKK